MTTTVMTARIAPHQHGLRLTPLAEIPVFALVTLLVVVRFLTERIGVLPRVFNAIDIVLVPLLVPLVFAFWLIRPVPIRPSWVAWLCLAFTMAWGLAWLMNADDVHWLGALLFAGGLMMPIVFFLILAALPLSESFPERLTRWLTFLLGVNVVIALTDALSAPRGIDDFLFGTFGLNTNQLAFFLAVMLSLLVARWRCGQLSAIGKGLAVVTAALFLLCGFQTLWIVFAAAMIAVHVAFTRLDRRVLVLSVVAVTMPLLVLGSYRSQRFDVGYTFSEAWGKFDRLGKVQLVRDAGAIVAERPAALIWGVGPGTFNSRAFRSIAIVPYDQPGNTDVAAAIVTPFYTSSLSAQYIIPYFTRGVFLLSGANTDGPFTSYVSVPIEVGLLGALPLFGLYGVFVWHLRRDVRGSRDPRLRVMAMWALSCLTMLLGISVVDNYLETTRYTMLVWLTVGLWYLHRRALSMPGHAS